MRICTAKASGINREAAKSGCAREWGGWGRISEDGPGQQNPDRSEGPWGRAAESARTEVFRSASSLTQRRESRWQQRARRAMANQFAGKAASELPALKPYRGKPAVRNFRGGDGNVGIIRSPVRAIALPDNRHGVEDERASRERSSDPLGLESCAATARDTAKRRQRIGGVGIQLRKDAIRTLTLLLWRKAT